MRWPAPPRERLVPLVVVGMMERIDRRTAMVVRSMLERLPGEQQAPVLAHAVVAAALGLQPRTAHDPDDNVWLVLPSLSGQPWMLIPGYEVGLWWIDGELWYCLDPIHDDDLIDISSC